MRGDVVGAGLDPELESLGPGVPDEAGRPPVLTVVEVAPLRSIGAGRVLVFVGGVEALIDFDQRLEFRVVSRQSVPWSDAVLCEEVMPPSLRK